MVWGAAVFRFDSGLRAGRRVGAPLAVAPRGDPSEWLGPPVVRMNVSSYLWDPLSKFLELLL